ncbi:MAG: 2-isopropylmalate synthase [Clostridiales bacterium]|jgi:2-isopropylmalate synthase|nr:2-isopropylmalate synthase [Clostridiales bacterium]
MEKRIIQITDTTMRDGEQTPGVRLGVHQKVEFARQLERLGVDVIEAGFPASSPGDFQAVEAVARAVSSCTVQALCRAMRGDIDKARQALADAKKPCIHIFLASSPLHLQYKLKITEEEALAAVADTVAYAKQFCAQVQFSPEDATRSQFSFLCRMIQTALDSGADIINIPDTVGYAAPEEFAGLIRRLHEAVPALSGALCSVHCHDDLGLAVANSLAAIGAGAGRVECTVNGLGERAGNAALEEIVMALHVRQDILGARTNIRTRELVRTSRMAASLTAVAVPPGKAIVGQNAFSHESGIHQHGVLENRETYEIMQPADIGLDKNMLILGKLSGRHAFSQRLELLGYALDDKGIDAAFHRFKEIADKKTSVTDEDIGAIVNEYLDGLHGKYWLESFQIQSGNHMKAMALLSLRDGDMVFTEAAPGDGPVNAAFNAIDRTIGRDDIVLESYEIRAVTEGTDALGEAKVKISAAGASFTGRGVSTDIIKASIKAYINAVNKCVAAGSDQEE